MTAQYAELAELRWEGNPALCGWVQEGDAEWFIPPLGLTGFRTDHPTWAGFLNDRGARPGIAKALDRQYIYSAHEFNEMKGNRWATFRKNVRKYPARTKEPLNYIRLDDDTYTDQIGDLLERWADGREVQDHVVMIRFLLLGFWRWGLFAGDRLVGVNVADENHAHGVFRYCIDDGTPFLNEYLRWRFYTSNWAQEKKWINDGGDLDNEKLARFKLKLNPVQVAVVYSYS